MNDSLSVDHHAITTADVLIFAAHDSGLINEVKLTVQELEGQRR